MLDSLDPKTLEAIAELICGDKGPYYRTGSKLPIFFRNVGLECPNHDGSTRKWWVLEQLKNYSTKQILMKKIIERLADPKEYNGDRRIVEDMIGKLNTILGIEGYKIALNGVKPRIHPILPELKATDKNISNIIRPDFSILSKDKEIIKIFDKRWEELQKCLEYHIWLSGIIMMGSILEGALLVVVDANPKEANSTESIKNKDGNSKQFKDLSLDNLISIAHECSWINKDRKEFSATLRQFRNIVHIREQRKTCIYPDEGTCNMCLSVLLEALKDLISSQKKLILIVNKNGDENEKTRTY